MIVLVRRCRFSFLVCCIGSSGFAQPNLPQFYAHFYNALINDSATLSSYVHPGELELAKRLGIQYIGVKNKFTISFDFDDEMKRGIRDRSLNAVVKVDSLEGGNVKLGVEIATKGLTKFFYFHNEKLVSPVFHFARNWRRWESKHFQLWISDTSQFHPEAMNQLEGFLQRSAALLQLSKTDMQLLEREKLIYVLCKDEGEIEQLTGYRTRGMYLLPYDYVVTTYSCHYHELLHQVMNFKLRSLPLYTHPFLQEGFAVAFGGRGGIAAQTIFQSGVFLYKSNFADYRELFAASEFLQQDASMTYPLSGLYVRFLFERIGVQRFLKLYRTFSGTTDAMRKMVLSVNELPSQQLWEKFVDSVATHPTIRLDEVSDSRTQLLKSENVSISVVADFYEVEMRNHFTLRAKDVNATYSSVKFNEILPNERYNGERYLFTADSNEVVVYDLFANNSIAGYAAGFSLPPKAVPSVNRLYKFYVRKDVFPIAPSNFEIITY